MTKKKILYKARRIYRNILRQVPGLPQTLGIQFKKMAPTLEAEFCEAEKGKNPRILLSHRLTVCDLEATLLHEAAHALAYNEQGVESHNEIFCHWFRFVVWKAKRIRLPTGLSVSKLDRLLESRLVETHEMDR